MIEAHELISKMGKKRFVDFAINNRVKGESMINTERRRSRGKNIKFRMCEHGVFVINNYVRKNCKKCVPFRKTSVRSDVNYVGFNGGLGVYTESYSDFKKACKLKGATPIGTDRAR